VAEGYRNNNLRSSPKWLNHTLQIKDEWLTIIGLTLEFRAKILARYHRRDRRPKSTARARGALRRFAWKGLSGQMI
jgi:hypothetical protein